MQQKGELISFRPDIKVVDCTIRDGGLVNNFYFDDEFVKDISEFDTVAEYREDVRKKLDAKAHADVAADIDNQLMEQLNDLLEAEIPEAMIELQIDEELRAFNFRLQSQGLKLETYMQLTGTNPCQKSSLSS